MEGTRKIPGHIPTHPMQNEHRYWARFRSKGPAEYIRQVILPEPMGYELVWLTYDDTNPEDDTDPGQRQIAGLREQEPVGGQPEPLTQRQKRQRQQNLTRSRLRNYTPSWHEVVMVQCCKKVIKLLFSSLGHCSQTVLDLIFFMFLK